MYLQRARITSLWLAPRSSLGGGNPKEKLHSDRDALKHPEGVVKTVNSESTKSKEEGKVIPKHVYSLILSILCLALNITAS